LGDTDSRTVGSCHESVKAYATKQLAAWTICLLTSGFCLSAAGQNTTFTYQGRLSSNGSSTEGSYDFGFRLATDPLATNYIGSPVFMNAVFVTNGLFTVEVDFGSGVFNGNSYWLEVDVRTNGAAGYTALYPLQPFTPTPYATFANTASNLSGSLPAAQLSGVVPSANLSGIYTGAVTFISANGNFSGNGSGLTNVATTQLGSVQTQAVIYGLVSNEVDVVSIIPVLTNAWPGGPFWSSSSYAPIAWQYFQPSIGTNISGSGNGRNGANSMISIKRNRAYVPSSNFGIQSFYPTAGAYTGNPGYQTAGISYLFNLDSDRFCLGMAGNNGNFKLLVNGVEQAASTRMPNDGNNYIYQVTFASIAQRQIEIEMTGNGVLEGIYVPLTDSLAPLLADSLKRLIIIGDSYTEEFIPNYTDPNGNLGVGLGYGTRLGQLMPTLDVWSLGSGGTGYSNTDGGLRLNFPNRMQIDIVSNLPDYVLFAGGINDIGYPADALYSLITNTFAQVLAGCPNTRIFSLGPWWPRSPVDPTAITLGITISNALAFYGLGSNYIDNLSGTSGSWITGVYNVPGSGNATRYISGDGTHPTPEGHWYLARRLAVELSNRRVPAVLGPSEGSGTTSGVTSTASNGQELVAIAIGPSPFHFTNTFGKNVFVFSARGTVTAISLNGSALPPAFLSGPGTYPLQPNEILTVTYSAPPTMLWKPF